MKKVWVVLSLVLGLQLWGCQSQDPLRGFQEEEQPAVAASNRKASWDSNLRPTRVASSQKQIQVSDAARGAAGAAADAEG